jgi:ATP-dependent Lhr-like helicase
LKVHRDNDPFGVTAPWDHPPTAVPTIAPGRWFDSRGWQPHAFQREVWAAMARSESGLLHATTGSGKTLAVWLGALQRARPGPGLQVLWITPMRALASDTTRAIGEPLTLLLPQWQVGQRSGDTPSAERARQEKRWPQALVTTPESLSLMLTRSGARGELSGLLTVIVDEWHELIASKRGVQVQLALARLKHWNPGLVVWGLSATLGNLEEAMATLVGHERGTLVQGRLDKALVIDTLLPREPGRFSWAGHLGAQMLEPVVDEIAKTAPGASTLVFTNVRSQAEIWYQLILQARPDWAGEVAIHHGSLDKSVRDWVEAGLKAGTLKAVVATSSLDLGVDFLPVERALQIGSAKGIARLLQRAGRSGHAPGRASRITLVPTNTLELVEATAARRAALAGRVESRRSPAKPLDVLVQHLVTVALGGGFVADELRAEVRQAPAYATLTDDEFDWAMRFCERGGDSLGAYPEYHRIQLVDGLWRVPGRALAQRHRLQIGTITADATMRLAWWGGGGGGGTLGSIEEGFVARLSAGDCFIYGGRLLEYVRTQDMVAYVRKATKKSGIVPAWAGSKMPFSSELAESVQAVLDGAAQGDFFEPELHAAQPMLATQARLSALPRKGRLLIETFVSREGQHLFVYPFAGRTVHVGLAQLVAWRLSARQPNTFSLSVNDYGFEVLAVQPFDLDAALAGGALWRSGELQADVLASLNSGELAQRRFREIARVAGLVFSGYPGAPKSLRQVQASSSLFYEVFRKYDPGNRLLGQAESEVLAQELDIAELRRTLQRVQRLETLRIDLASPSPFALPLMVERLREQLTTEKLKDRLQRLIAEAEQGAGPGADGGGARVVPEAPARASSRPARPRRRPVTQPSN